MQQNKERRVSERGRKTKKKNTASQINFCLTGCRRVVGCTCEKAPPSQHERIAQGYKLQHFFPLCTPIHSRVCTLSVAGETQTHRREERESSANLQLKTEPRKNTSSPAGKSHCCDKSLTFPFRLLSWSSSSSQYSGTIARAS